MKYVVYYWIGVAIMLGAACGFGVYMDSTYPSSSITINECPQ